QALQTLMIQAKDRGRATKPFDNKAMSVELAKVSERAEDFAAASGYWFVAARNNNDVNQVIDFLEHSIDAYKKVEP
ncbi:hypothetical protein ACSTKO_24970, partial [Vibrio parahaemolyticus]